MYVRCASRLLLPAVNPLCSLRTLQACLLTFFWVDSVHQFWYNYGVLSLTFVGGLFGGVVYGE